jgi:hypothetical protein
MHGHTNVKKAPTKINRRSTVLYPELNLFRPTISFSPLALSDANRNKIKILLGLPGSDIIEMHGVQCHITM